MTQSNLPAAASAASNVPAPVAPAKKLATPDSVTDPLAALADKILGTLQARLGPKWNTLLDDAGRKLVADIAADAAELSLKGAAANGDVKANAAFKAEWAQINAQLANVTAGEASQMINTFWAATQAVLAKTVAVAAAAIIA